MAKETKTRTPKSTATGTPTTNTNLGTFVDAVTPIPKNVMENYIDFNELNSFMKSLDPARKELVNTMIDIALSTCKAEQFLSYGEQIAVNSLRKINVLR
jgi:hypothetical protein